MIYRYPKEGQISGVCLGLARHFGFDAWVVRLTVIILFFCGGYFFMPLIYIAGALLMEKAPENYYVSPPTAFNKHNTQWGETQWTSPYTTNNQLKNLQLEFHTLKQRTQQLEKYVKSNTFSKNW